MAGRTPQQDEQRSSSNAEKFMDEYLQALGLCRKKIAKDGSCLFRAVAEQVLLSQSRHLEVRRTCVDYLAENRQKYEAFIEGSFEEYLQRLENPQNWVGEVEISALALIYKHDFVIFQEPGKPPVNITENNFPDKVQLCFLNGNHYDSIYPKEFVQDAALCQSILYELLYEKVFGVDHETLASSLQSSNGTDEDFTEREDSDESDLDGEEAYWADGEDDITEMNKFRSFQGDKVHKPHHSGFHLPQRVLKSLNPSFFRNVEYDVWQRSKKAQQNMDYCIAAGMQFHIGDKCKVSLDHSGKFYNAYIQEVLPNNGPVVVFVEELAEKRSISLRNIRPSSEEPLPWSTVAEKGKRASTVNGHGTDRDSRGTRKLTKATAKSPLAPSTYIQPAGQSRAQQQLPPWPLVQSQQSPPEDRAGGKAFSTRKCDLGLPCPKGLTDERMAKEAEQESQAQFDILQKDEENFPALSSQKVCPAATQTSAGQKNVNPQTSDRKGSRRRMEAQEQPRESESKTPSHACVRKVEKNKPLAKNTGESCQKKMLSPPPPEQKPSVQNPVSPQQGLVQPLYSPGLPSSDPTPTPSPPASAGPQTATPPSSLTPPALPADPPPYETATSCPAGVMPPMGISSVPPPPAMAELISPARVNVSPMPPPPVHLPPVSQPSMPFPQMQFPYQDPLYPGFPLNEKDEIVAAPSYSYCRNGDDLPRDKCILRFFFNLGLKAYTCPMWPPHSYILPLHQAYLNVCAMQPKVPDPASYTPPWFPETPAAAHRVNSAPPANTMPMQENPGYNLPGPAGVRALGQFELPHGTIQPCTRPSSTETVHRPDCMPGPKYVQQPSMPLPVVHLGRLPWPGQGHSQYMGGYTAPTPLFSPIPLRCQVPQFPSGNSAIAEPPQINPANSQEGKTGSLGFSERVSSVPTTAANMEPYTDPNMIMTLKSSAAEVDITEKAAEDETFGDGTVGAGAGAEMATPPQLLAEEVSAAGLKQSAQRPLCKEGNSLSLDNRHEASAIRVSNVHEAVGIDRELENPRETEEASQWSEQGTEKSSGVAHLPGEDVGEYEISDTMPRRGRSYYGRSYRGKRGFDDGQGFRETRSRGQGRGSRRWRESDDGREYNYREGKYGERKYREKWDHQTSVHGEKSSHFRGAPSRSRGGRRHNQQASDREAGYTRGHPEQWSPDTNP